MLQVKRENYDEADGDDSVYMLTFTYKSDEVEFTFYPENTTKKWGKLADVIESGGKYSIDWSPCNGECSIYLENGRIAFNVAKHGDGNGGDLNVSIPAINTLSGFRMAHELTK
jgi:hypothetical protein